jgi:hypothetical protein
LLGLTGDTPEKEDGLDYVVDEPVSILQDLSELGIEEVDRGICEDSFENRAILRRARLQWEPVYSSAGAPAGLIKVRTAESTRERRLLSLAEKRPILSVPTDNNSDYLTGLDLIAEEASDYLVPPWVVHATRLYLKEQETGHLNPKRAPLCQPHRCRHIKTDGIRCMLWGSGRPKDDGLCRVHLRSVKHKTSDDIERAREKLMQAAPFAVDKLEELMEFAESEPVKLKAATEILDRAGVRGGVEIDTNVNIDVRPAAQIIAERLERLTLGAATAARLLTDDGVQPIDAEVVIEEPASAGSETFNEESKAAAAGSETEERPATTTNQEEK